MKISYKKTGEIVELKLIQVNDKYIEDHEVDFLNGEKLTLKLLVDTFDDVKEPLIKNEKIRKAVRAWAESGEIRKVVYDDKYSTFKCFNSIINFDFDYDGRELLECGNSYTIAELCGEEE